MPLEFVAGDLLQSDAQYIAQGVAEGNQEGLGTGLAFKISKHWPEAQAAFKKHARGGTFRGGSLWVYPPQAGQPGLVYLATQPDMYRARLSYLRKVLRRLVIWAEAEGVCSVALPKIGAGLGKLSWEREVKPLLIEQLSASLCHFLVYESFRFEDEDPDS